MSVRFGSGSANSIDNSNFLSSFEESLTVAIRPPKHSSQGFTLVEMLVSLIITGIIGGLAVPSLLSLNKPFKNGVLQFKAHLSLIRSKAISSNKAYRIRPKFTAVSGYPDGIVRNFVVEYADNCNKSENNVVPVATRWQMASQLDLDLPQNIGLPTAPPPSSPTMQVVVLPNGNVTSTLNWTGTGMICFDNRGIREDTTTKIILRDSQRSHRAKVAELEITKVGSVDISTYTEITAPTDSALGNYTKIDPSGDGNPEF
jgi:prepilin-type N-terminal cleavage/methylation domain-containing protein